MRKKHYLVWFDEVDKDDVELVGGKGANLGEMTKAHFPVPSGFILTAPAYFRFIKENNIERDIRHILRDVSFDDPRSLQHASEKIKSQIIKSKLPDDIATEILKAYHRLSYYDSSSYHRKKTTFREKLHELFGESLVAVRSSATAEDLPQASFAGQQATFLNVQGDVELLEKVKACYASLFEARAIFYRRVHAFDHFKVGIAVPVQKMVQADASGVMFTQDPVTNEKGKIVIEAIYGLGELIVQGAVTPDYYEVNKKTLTLIEKKIEKQTAMLRRVGKTTKETKVSRSLQAKQKISDRIIEEIARLGKRIEHHYFFPQDIEWALQDGKAYIVQTRPITTIQQTINNKRQTTIDKLGAVSSKLTVLLRGDPASPGISSGPTKIILVPKHIDKVKPGDVLVAPKTSPDYVPAMRKACAIVTDHGGRTSHAAIVSRELGIPCVVGTDIATKKLKNGIVVTVNGTTGEIFKGGYRQVSGVRYQVSGMDMFEAAMKTKTKLYVNLAEPERAAEVAKMDVDGVGLLRAEFMIAQIGLHPNKIIKDRRQKIFIDKLAENLGIFCEHFNPRPVVYRLSDFKTNEYRNLKGGLKFEPNEENPMIGFRGTLRLVEQASVLKLEIDAIKKVREEFDFKNLWLMIPYVRTVAELIDIKRLLSSFGLTRSSTFKLWMMVEIPSNVILIEDFLSIGIDGVSIGSNDLTMLTLGTDRDNERVASVFDEQDPALLWSFEHVIKACRKHGLTSSICGQAPSVYPHLVEKLVPFGITSISVNPDALVSTRKTIYNTERRLKWLR